MRFSRIIVCILILTISTTLILSAQTSKLDSLETKLINSINENRIPILLELSSRYQNINPEKSFGYAKEVLKLNKNKNTSETVQAYIRIAAYYGGISSYELSAENLTPALDIALKLKDDILLSEIYNHFGSINYKQSNYDQALDFYKKAVQYAGLNKLESAIKLMNIGKIYYYRGNYDEALKYYHEVRKIADEHSKTILKAHSLKEIGTIYYKWQNYQEARNNFNLALVIYEEASNKKRVAIVLNWLGMTYKKEENYSLAIEYQKKSLSIQQELNSPIGIANSLNGLGISYKKLNDFDTAISYYEKALKIQKEINDNTGAAATLSNIGRLFQELNSYDKALRSFEESNKIALELGYLQAEMDNYHSMALTFKQMNNSDLAFQYFEKYLTLKDSVFNEEKHSQFAEMQTKYETEKKEQENQILKHANNLQKLSISKHKLKQNTLFAISVIILISLFLIIRQYKLKLRILQKLEEASKIINIQNSELEKMNERKSKYFSLVSHDLKSALSSLQMGSELLQEINELDEDEAQTVANEMNYSIQNLQRFLENLLEWSRIQFDCVDHKPENCNLKNLVEDVVLILNRKSDFKRITLKSSINEKTVVYADKNMILSVLQNLIANAIKFTPESGLIEITENTVNDMVEVTISDNGQGVSEDDLNKLFLVSETTSRLGTNGEKGTGLGLILCKEFIEKNRGEINLTSKILEGTAVTFTLPVLNVKRTT